VAAQAATLLTKAATAVMWVIRSRAAASSTPSDSEAVRPDPRWALELKTKQMLAAQTTNG